MDEGGDGYRRFLEVQLEGLQDQLYALERDLEQVEYLKSILRACQRLRHAQGPEEPESVRILRNAVEKVTLHLGLADLAVTQDDLDFYVDSFDLLEEAVRRWPGGPSFDRARYADRVRALIERDRPRRPVPVGAQAKPEWRGSAAEPALEVRGERDLESGEREAFVEADLRDFLAEPWRGETKERVPAAVTASAPAGGLAASFATYETLRADPAPELAAALTALRDVLDAFSLSLNDLDRASERLLEEDWGGLGREAAAALVERLEGERDKLLTVFDRTIESFRAGAV